MPIGLSFTVDGIDKLVQKLGSAVAEQTLKPVVERGVEQIRKRLATYPPERPGQSYERTGNLARGWKTNVSGLQATVSNSVSYGPFVQGDHTQARMHQGRWLTEEQAYQREIPSIEADLHDAVEKALGS